MYNPNPYWYNPNPWYNPWGWFEPEPTVIVIKDGDDDDKKKKEDFMDLAYDNRMCVCVVLIMSMLLILWGLQNKK